MGNPCPTLTLVAKRRALNLEQPARRPAVLHSLPWNPRTRQQEGTTGHSLMGLLIHSSHKHCWEPPTRLMAGARGPPRGRCGPCPQGPSPVGRWASKQRSRGFPSQLLPFRRREGAEAQSGEGSAFKEEIYTVLHWSQRPHDGVFSGD